MAMFAVSQTAKLEVLILSSPEERGQVTVPESTWLALSHLSIVGFPGESMFDHKCARESEIFSVFIFLCVWATLRKTVKPTSRL